MDRCANHIKQVDSTLFRVVFKFLTLAYFGFRG